MKATSQAKAPVFHDGSRDAAERREAFETATTNTASLDFAISDAFKAKIDGDKLTITMRGLAVSLAASNEAIIKELREFGLDTYKANLLADQALDTIYSELLLQRLKQHLL